MKVNTKKTLLFVTTILSLLILFLGYYEILRYISIYFFGIDHYLNNYSTLEKNNDTVIIINSKESNIDKLDKTLKSIFDQTFKTSEVVVYAMKGKHTDKLTKYKEYGIKVKEKPETIYTEHTDIYDSVKKYESTTYILSLNDDIVYGKDYVAVMIETSRSNPSTLIKQNQGIIFKPDYFSTDISNANVKDDPFKFLKAETEILKYNLNYHTI